MKLRTIRPDFTSVASKLVLLIRTVSVSWLSAAARLATDCGLASTRVMSTWVLPMVKRGLDWSWVSVIERVGPRLLS